MTQRTDKPWYRDSRFWISTIVASIAALPGVIALFQTQEIRVQLDSWSDAKLKVEVGRSLQDFGEFLDTTHDDAVDSMQAISNRLSFRGLGRGGTLIKLVSGEASRMSDSIEHRWKALNRRVEDYVMQSGFRDITISEVEFLKAEADLLEQLALKKERTKTLINEHMEEMLRSRGLP